MEHVALVAARVPSSGAKPFRQSLKLFFDQRICHFSSERHKLRNVHAHISRIKPTEFEINWRSGLRVMDEELRQTNAPCINNNREMWFWLSTPVFAGTEREQSVPSSYDTQQVLIHQGDQVEKAERDGLSRLLYFTGS